MKTRTFDDQPAVRSRVPLLIGLMGPSGGGKTFSALRLAKGIQSVVGGDIYVIDTEARRALHYADQFTFRHVAFAAPFGPLDYLAAIEHCEKKGAGVVIVDSMSHEHEGPGGVLDSHDRETERLAKQWGCSREKATMAGWSKPKQERRRLINGILQLPINVISCFRAKEKIKLKRGEDPRPMGFMAIAGEEYIFEQTINALLLPGAGGVPTWSSDEIGERQMIKLPGWARSMLTSGEPLDEAMGSKLAMWAAGTKVRSVDEVLAELAACFDPASLGALKTEARILARSNKDRRDAITRAVEDATARVKEAEERAAAADEGEAA